VRKGEGSGRRWKDRSGRRRGGRGLVKSDRRCQKGRRKESETRQADVIQDSGQGDEETQKTKKRNATKIILKI